ncbi:MAG: histidinol dehydrogenase [Gammaproteobacteria bacterium]|nr:histidinol dehydrogenase [Gammaproteobacteria bacterium]MCP5199408.1 histidinol dehydrogenase [Gammaproteobacteria bacterium]
MPDVMRRLDASAADFPAVLEALLAWDEEERPEIAAAVRDIVAAVRRDGDAALLDCTNRFDRRALATAAALEVTDFASAVTQVPTGLRAALEAAADRVRRYHEHQKATSWDYREDDGTCLGQQVVPLDRVGIYVPGGKAAYPSSVLMNAIPARVAGVGEIVMAVPAPDDHLEPVVLAAAAIAGVDRVFTIGGAQAVAALAYGTATVPAVDKIVGPGNAYVAAAKAMVFGRVGIDMIAGPSEILIVCDGQTDPDWIAMDLFSQAEHDEMAQSILLSPDRDFLAAVAASVERLLPRMPRAAIIRAALAGRGALIEVRDLDQAVELVNRIAPEHLELSVAEPRALLPRIRHAGAIFLGRHTPEAIGDYCAGPNHVLPTAGTSRFSSPLGVYDFQKRSSLIECSPAGAAELGRLARVLAEAEGLQAHARSAGYRVGDE